MARKYHNSPDGPRPCDAEVRPCKYAQEGAPHYETEQEAQAAYEKQEAEAHGQFASQRKKAKTATEFAKSRRQEDLHELRRVWTRYDEKRDEINSLKNDQTNNPVIGLATRLSDGTWVDHKELPDYYLEEAINADLRAQGIVNTTVDWFITFDGRMTTNPYHAEKHA